MKKILVTGGAGYIGSHTCVELLNEGYDIVVVDNFSNSSKESLERVKKITGRDFRFYQADLRDGDEIARIFQENEIDAVIHFAGLKAVGESVEKPLEYYGNNLISTLSLCRAMRIAGVKKLVFSSSATVYGDPQSVPIREDAKLGATNPYGRTKLMIEEILGDLSASDKEWSIILLRYFNPIGAHQSGLIGEDPSGIPNNLLPYISQVAIGRLGRLNIYGNDYSTLDGTGVRDYIHVSDLALGHCRALVYADGFKGIDAVNLGTGCGYSVLQIVGAFEKACGHEIPYVISDRRSGDIAECFADPSKAALLLGWKAELGIDRMCEDIWRWQTMNPDGYGS
ncbi:MAG: UDP-glucose 4-epimerase GalE [Saccharofermentanales bacterium]